MCLKALVVAFLAFAQAALFKPENSPLGLERDLVSSHVRAELPRAPASPLGIQQAVARLGSSTNSSFRYDGYTKRASPGRSTSTGSTTSRGPSDGRVAIDSDRHKLTFDEGRSTFAVDDRFIATRGVPKVGGGAKLENLLPSLQQRIQAFADKFKVDVSLVGSRAKGTAGPASDFDFAITGANSKIRRQAERLLPRGASGGGIRSGGTESGIDILTGPLDQSLPHITFFPQ